MPRKYGTKKARSALVRLAANEKVIDHHKRFTQHKCPDCPAKLETRELWVAHLDSHRHREIPPIPCHSCPLWFNGESKLQEHLISSPCGGSQHGADVQSNERDFAYWPVVKEEPIDVEESVPDEENSMLFMMDQSLIPNAGDEPVTSNSISKLAESENTTFEPPSPNPVGDAKSVDSVEKLPRYKPILSDLQCAICWRVLSSQIALRNHERNHRNERSFQCDLCEKNYPSSLALSTHKKKIHKIMPKRVRKTLNAAVGSVETRNRRKAISKNDNSTSVAPEEFAGELLSKPTGENSISGVDFSNLSVQVEPELQNSQSDKDEHNQIQQNMEEDNVSTHEIITEKTTATALAIVDALVESEVQSNVMTSTGSTSAEVFTGFGFFTLLERKKIQIEKETTHMYTQRNETNNLSFNRVVFGVGVPFPRESKDVKPCSIPLRKFSSIDDFMNHHYPGGIPKWRRKASTSDSNCNRTFVTTRQSDSDEDFEDVPLAYYWEAKNRGLELAKRKKTLSRCYQRKKNRTVSGSQSSDGFQTGLNHTIRVSAPTNALDLNNSPYLPSFHCPCGSLYFKDQSDFDNHYTYYHNGR